MYRECRERFTPPGRNRLERPKTATSATPVLEVTWPRSRFNTSGPDPLGFDWGGLAASWGTAGGHSGRPLINNLWIDSRHYRLQSKPLVSDPGMHHGTWSGTCRGACRDRWPMVAGKTFPAFMAHAQPTIFPIWQEAHVTGPLREEDAEKTLLTHYGICSWCCLATGSSMPVIKYMSPLNLLSQSLDIHIRTSSICQPQP